MKTKLTILLILCCLSFHLFSQDVGTDLEKANELYKKLIAFNQTSPIKTFDDRQRTSFSFIPRTRTGMSLKDMDEKIKTMTFVFLQTLLSDAGMKKVKGIIELEDILRETEGRPIGNPYRDQGKYYLNFYGKPSETKPWAVSFEGHHISLNFTFSGEKLTGTPLFLGANPATVYIERKKGLQTLKQEEDLARELVQSLSPEQTKIAIISNSAPFDIVSGSSSQVEIDSFEGIPYGQLNEEQRKLLKELTKLYVFNVGKSKYETYLNKIESWGWESIYFAWAGGTNPGEGHYYKIMGPTLLIEYDNTQNGANHIHSVWRDSEEDFGRNLLEEHYRDSPHHR